MRERTFGFAIALAIFIADQLTKWIVAGPLALREVGQIHILPIFNLTWTQNYGISLGMLQATSDTMRWVLVAVTSAIAVGVAYWIGRERARWDQAALGMILGGALGNILDRVRFGYVVDFADLHISGWKPFYIFNVADAAISIGVVILLVRAFVTRNEQRSPDPEETIEHA